MSRLQALQGADNPADHAEAENGGVELRFSTVPDEWANDGNVRGVTVDGKHYALFAPPGATWDRAGGVYANDLAGDRGSGYVTIALLPDDAKTALVEFGRYAYN